jgi:hypothetical protein
MAHLFFSYAHNGYNRLISIFQRMELVNERMIWTNRISLHGDAEWAAMIEQAIKSSYQMRRSTPMPISKTCCYRYSENRLESEAMNLASLCGFSIKIL